MLKRENFAALVAEFLSAGLLTLTFLAVSRSGIGLPYFVALASGLTIAGVILTAREFVSGFGNPAVTFALWSVRKLTTLRAAANIAAQVVGAVLTMRLYTYVTNSALEAAAIKFDWRVFTAEAVGTFVLAWGVTAAIYQKQEVSRFASTVGISVAVAMIVASAASSAIVNPAVALGVQSWSWAYAAAPFVGALVGSNVYSLLFAGDPFMVSGGRQKSTSVAAVSSTKKATSSVRTKSKKTTKKK